MVGQMCWLSMSGNEGEKILHLRNFPNEAWQPYTAFPLLAAKDYLDNDGSRGWATYQKLQRQGWKLIASNSQISLNNQSYLIRSNS